MDVPSFRARYVTTPNMGYGLRPGLGLSNFHIGYGTVVYEWIIGLEFFFNLRGTWDQYCLHMMTVKQKARFHMV